MNEERPFEPKRFNNSPLMPPKPFDAPQNAAEAPRTPDLPVAETRIFDIPAEETQSFGIPSTETPLFDIPVPEMPEAAEVHDIPETPAAPEASEAPEAPAAPKAPAAPEAPAAPVHPEGAYRYPYGSGSTPVRPQQYGTRPAAPAPAREAEQAEKKPAKKAGRVWIPILIIAALLLALGGAAAGYFIGRAGKQAADVPVTEAPAPTLPKNSSMEKPSEEQPPVSEHTKPAQSGDALTPAEVYSSNVNAVVGIASESTGRNIWGQAVTQASSGSGFVLTSDGFVVTNYHVVEGASSVTVQLYDGREFPAQIVGYENTTCDVALLKIDATDLATVSIGDSDEIQVGQQVCAIGNPLGELTFTLTVGYISALDREINTDGRPINMLQTDAAINAGNSGGPLFDTNGNVIGINTAKYSASLGETAVEGLGFAIPINDIMKIVDDLTQYGYVVGKPYLGVSVDDSSSYGENLPAGAYVGQVIEGGAADKAGLQVGDVIVGLGDSVVGSQSDLQKALASYSAGDTVSVTIYREGQYLSVELTLDERPKDAESSVTPDEQPAPTDETEAKNPWGDWEDWGFGNWGSLFP